MKARIFLDHLFEAAWKAGTRVDVPAFHGQQGVIFRTNPDGTLGVNWLDGTTSRRMPAGDLRALANDAPPPPGVRPSTVQALVQRATTAPPPFPSTPPPVPASATRVVATPPPLPGSAAPTSVTPPPAAAPAAPVAPPSTPAPVPVAPTPLVSTSPTGANPPGWYQVICQKPGSGVLYRANCQFDGTSWFDRYGAACTNVAQVVSPAKSAAPGGGTAAPAPVAPVAPAPTPVAPSATARRIIGRIPPRPRPGATPTP